MAEPKDADQAEFAGIELPQILEDATRDLQLEVVQLQEQLGDQRDRIRDLEQALDQSLASLEELRLQMVDQHFLERQLASTEEIANVQQQAIHHLKRQFAQQRAELEIKIEQAQQREREYQSLLDAAEAIAQSQQLELDHLRAQLGIEAEIRPTPVEQQLRILQADIELRRQQLHDLEAQKQISQARIAELEGQVEALEGQIARQFATQALLQQACQELELDREQSQHRIAELERQAAEMQEQILSQAQQASEYETAVQHWKGRFHSLQEKVESLKRSLEAAGTNLPPEFADLIASLEAPSMSEPKSTHRANPFSPDLKIDLPEFLVRRRTYRRSQNRN